MNSLLLDTQVLLWWLISPKKISKKSFQEIESQENLVFASAASVWEIAIKASIKRLTIPNDLIEQISESNFKILPIEARHAYAVKNLPLIHKDPFHRILITQAQSENLTLVTEDPYVMQYQVKFLKA